MARLTKSDIERSLLAGFPVEWQDPNGKKSQLMLGRPVERCLFAFLSASGIRSASGLTAEFIDGLHGASDADTDPAITLVASGATPSAKGPWRLMTVECEGFGGVNFWGGPAFRFDADGESYLIEGPNGSGKSSLTAAVIWALTGERPRDHSEGYAHEAKDVLGPDDRSAGQWPPIASYPPSAGDLLTVPRVRVKLTFNDSSGNIATAERVLESGAITAKVDAALMEHTVLLETGLLMPSRFPRLRLDDGGGTLTDAVRKLTGLDDLAAIGDLAAGLCHGAKEYLAHGKKELAEAMRTFEASIERCRSELAAVGVPVDGYVPADTDATDGKFAAFGTTLRDKAAELSGVIASDLASGIDLSSASAQNEVIASLASAKRAVEGGLDALPSWGKLQTLSEALGGDVAATVSAALATARNRAKEASILHERSERDTKFRMKAVAARWHAAHKSGRPDHCPLCEHGLDDDSLLVTELAELRSAGDAATRTYEDNLNAIMADLEASLPAVARTFGPDALELDPRAKLIEEFRSKLADPRHGKILTAFVGLVDAAMDNAPSDRLDPVQAGAATDRTKRLEQKLAVVDRLLQLSSWFEVNSAGWTAWWSSAAGMQVSDAGAGTRTPDPAEVTVETLWGHLGRMNDAFERAGPYRRAAEAMRAAWTAGKQASGYEKERARRKTVADNLAPLKELVVLADSFTRSAIDGLSERIANLLERIHITESLKFREARLKKKEGLVVRGGFVPELRIDATLVANTSWLRAVLWAFIFALREEAVERIGTDPLPLFVFDDPQATFDATHRHRWAQHVAAMQCGQNRVQVILASHDEAFLELIKIGGVSGREAMIAPAGKELGYIGIFEGERLDREWENTKKLNTPAAGQSYLNAMRIHVEGLLRLMLRGDVPSTAGMVVGASRERISQMNEAGLAPWNRPEFRKLVSTLDKNSPPIKCMESAHHALSSQLGMAEATDLEKHWRKHLHPALENAFRVAREHRLLHGGETVLRAFPSTAALPEGYRDRLKAIPLQVIGRAAALSDGRAADGRFDAGDFSTSGGRRVTLAQHLAFRLVTPTLEPAARAGDILIVKDAGEPTPNSLVVAINEDCVLARRYEIASNHSDVVALVGQAINPRRTVPPVVGHKAGMVLHKVVGVLYGHGLQSGEATAPGWEICACTGEADLSVLASASGLVEVSGHSAEPHAIHGQYLIVGAEIGTNVPLGILDGRPIVAADTADNRYFKRLRLVTEDRVVVLESLDSGGDYGPEVLSAPGGEGNCLERIWPVLGVLFELP